MQHGGTKVGAPILRRAPVDIRQERCCVRLWSRPSSLLTKSHISSRQLPANPLNRFTRCGAPLPLTKPIYLTCIPRISLYSGWLLPYQYSKKALVLSLKPDFRVFLCGTLPKLRIPANKYLCDTVAMVDFGRAADH